MSELFSQLGINWKILIAQLINFGILVAILRWLLYQPLLELLEKRRAKLAIDVENSEAISEKLKTTATEEEKIIAEARKRGQELLATTEKAGKELKETLVAEAKKEAEKNIALGRQTLEEARAQMRDELKQEIGATVAMAIEKSLGDVLDKKVQEKLERSALEKI
ncbi:MAG TPA: F0F1 ATP synthase subunit B [Candidatus Paceibacterota bacterium]